LRVAIATLVTGVVIFAISELIQSPIASLIVVPPSGFISYSILSLRLSVIHPDEVEPLIQKLPSATQKYFRFVLNVIS